MPHNPGRQLRSYGTHPTEKASLLPTNTNTNTAEEDNPEESYQYPRPEKRLAWIATLVFLFSCLVFFTMAVFRSPAYLHRKEDYERVEEPNYIYGEMDVSSLNRDMEHMEEGTKHTKKKKKTTKKNTLDGGGVCNDGGYSKRTLKTAYELPFASLFRDNRGQEKYEASSVIIVDHNVYAVCDSSWAISKFGDELQPFSPNNVQIGDPNRLEEDSGYEALFHDGDTFYVVRESVKLTAAERDLNSPGSYHAIVEELAMGDTDYDVVDSCPSEFEFEGDSKGFEGAIPIHDLEDSLVVLGLCEGNYCSESHKDDTGNGRLVAMKKIISDDGSCVWASLREINIPPSANFRDYSAISVDENGRVAITSQEESQVWIGSLMGRNDDGLWDVDAIEFDPDVAHLYDFPKDNKCHTVYCNIEGIHWMNDNMLLAVSDKMKSKGKQDFRCFNKDQSVHAFVIP